MTDLNALSLKDLTARFNAQTGKSIKVGSYTKAKMIALLEIEGKLEEVASDPLPSFAKNLDASLTRSLVRKKTKIEFEPGSNESAPTPHEEPQEDKAEGSCPLCGGDPSSQTAAGAEGTFLGDECNFCHECLKTWNIHNGQEVEVSAEKTSKAKRRILNPQNKINAKVDAAAKAGLQVSYDKPSRIWSVSKGSLIILQLDSRGFAQYNPQELVDYALSRNPKE